MTIRIDIEKFLYNSAIIIRKENDMNKKAAVQILKAMADETRLEIVEMLSDGELCACKILENFNITQPTLSYHMKRLIDCGLVCGRRDGAWIRYSLKKDTFEAVEKLIRDFCKDMNNMKRADCCQS